MPFTPFPIDVFQRFLTVHTFLQQFIYMFSWQDQYGNYVVQRMMDTTDAAMLRELHVIMLVFIRDITPTINEKMHKNVDLNVQKPDVMHLAGVYFAQPDKARGWR